MATNIVKKNGIQFCLGDNKNFKFGRIRIILIDKLENVNFAARSVLVSMMNECSKKYPTNRDIRIASEELYSLILSSGNNFSSEHYRSIFTFNILDPKYVKESDYLDNIFSFIKEIIFNPLFIDKLCNEDIFIKCKNEFIENYKSINDTFRNFSKHDTKLKVFKGTSNEKYSFGTLEELESLTREDIYNEYIKLLNSNNLEVHSILNIDNVYLINNICEMFKDYKYDTKIFDSLSKEQYNFDLTYKSKFKSKQNILKIFYTFDNFNCTRKERFIVSHIFNDVLGSLGLSDLLSTKLRLDNKLVYSVSSSLSFSNHFLEVVTYLNKENVSKAKELIFSVIEDAKNGNIPRSLLDMAIKSEIADLNASKDSLGKELGDEISIYKYNDYSDEEYIKELQNITIDDLKCFANKLSLFAIYELEGEE